MTVSSTTSKAIYSGNGLTTTFAVPFYFLAAADLEVILRTGTTETVQTLTTQYTVTGAGVPSGGSVTMLTAPASGTTLTILRNIEATQETDLLPNDRLPAESLETALDKATMLIQQLDEVADRALQFPASDVAASSTLPVASLRAGKYLGFDAFGLPTVSSSSPTPYLATDVSFTSNGTGATPRSVSSKLREHVSVADFGVVGDGSDEAAKLQVAFNAISATGGVLYFPPTSASYSFSSSGSPLTITGNNVELNLAAGATLRQLTLNSFGITISGNNCSITGLGSISSNIQSLSDYFTTGSGIARAIVRVTGNYFTATGIQVNTPSRCGIFIDNATGARLEGVTGDGGYALADYNPASTLNLYVVYFDPPTQGTFSVINCSFRRYLSPIGSGNLSGVIGNSSGSQIINNRFIDCYDHAAYLYNCTGVIVANNYCENVRKPFVVDGTGAQIIDNVCIATTTGDTSSECGFSIRDANNAVISGNRLQGRGAYIDVSALAAGNLTDNQIVNNQLISTAASTELAASIRIASTTSLVLRNVIANNQITNVTEYNSSQGVITLQGNASFIGVNNQVDGNIVTMTTDATGFQTDYCNNTIHRNNIYDRSGYSAGSSTTVTVFYATNSNNLLTEFNEYRYLTGGTNVTSFAVSIQGTCNNPVIRGERNAMTSASLVSVNLIPAAGTSGYKTRNHYSLSSPLAGTATLGSGTGNAIVNNANVKSDSRIYLTPANGGAASQQSNHTTHKGVYAKNEFASSRFSIETGDGNATAVSGNWFWEIDG